jgi:hypothetical protein
MEAAASAITHIRGLVEGKRPLSETQQMFLDLYRDAEDLRETNLRQTEMLLAQQEVIIKLKKGVP